MVGSEQPDASHRTVQNPDQLDAAVEVTDSRAWIAVVAAVVVVVALLVWSFVGQIPERVSVVGVMSRPNATVQVFAPEAGTVSSVNVEASDSVEAGALLATLETSDGNTVEVRSPLGAVVQGVAARAGTQVAGGTALATLVDESSTARLRAITYVSPVIVQQLAGMEDVTVVPASVDESMDGSLDGTIVFLADVPASTAEMTEELGTPALANELTQASGGIPYLVIVEFDEPRDDIVAGTLAEISAIVERDRPIERVF